MINRGKTYSSLRITSGKTSLVLCLLIAAVAPRTSAQQRKSTIANLPVLSRFVPDSASLFLSIDRLPEINIRLQSQESWNLLLGLIGSNGQGGWKQILANTLGVETSSAITEMFRREVVIAAPNWQKLDEGIIVFTISNPHIVEWLIGPDFRKQGKTVGNVQVYKSRTGLWTAISGSIAVLSQKGDNASLFQKSIDLINGTSKASLLRKNEFRRRIGSLPKSRHVSAYWDAPLTKQGHSSNSLSAWWPPLESGAMSVFIRNYRLEFAFRGEINTMGPKIFQPRVMTDRLTSLPQNTLVAWSTSFEAHKLFDSITNASPPLKLQPLWDILQNNTDSERFREDVIANLGPRCIVLLASDFTDENLSPVLAVMIESVDSSAVVKAMHGFASQVIDAIQPDDPDNPPVALTSSQYLDTTIFELNWNSSQAMISGETLASLITENLSLTFAELNGWVIASTSPDHLRQMIRAYAGEETDLDSVVSLSSKKRQLRRSISTTIIQPSLALNLLTLWDSILNERLDDIAGRQRLGITVSSGETGRVIITDVDSNGPSYGVLRLGDAIIACNDTLLSMDNPNEHLRKLVAQTPADAPLRLRLYDRKEVFEASINIPEDYVEPQRDTGLAPFLNLLGRIDNPSLGFSSAIYSVDRPIGNVYMSQLILELENAADGNKTSDEKSSASVPPE